MLAVSGFQSKPPYRSPKTLRLRDQTYIFFGSKLRDHEIALQQRKSWTMTSIGSSKMEEGSWDWAIERVKCLERARIGQKEKEKK
jgi:hypothetical protein